MFRRIAPFFLALGLQGGLPTQGEALALAFPGAQFVRREHYLMEAQAAQVQALAGTALPGLWQVAYEARKDGRLAGVAFFDTHRVRTLNETVLVAIGADGRLLRVEVIAFREPAEYLPKEAWVRQFQGQKLDLELRLQGRIRPLSGATLTAHALTDAARRALALFQILYGGKG